MHEEKNIHNEETVEEEQTETPDHIGEIETEKREQDQDKSEKDESGDSALAEEKDDEMDREGKAREEAQEKRDDDVARLTAKIHELENKLQEKENRLLRLQADFENYRKRTRNEIEAFKKYRSQELALELLSSLDNFERALATEAQTDEGKAILEGMEMVYKSILVAFEKEGITPIDAVGQEFDPNYHHAVMQDNNDEYEANIITEELQKGYMIKDRVLRPSMVKVNQ